LIGRYVGHLNQLFKMHFENHHYSLCKLISKIHMLSIMLVCLSFFLQLNVSAQVMDSLMGGQESYMKAWQLSACTVHKDKIYMAAEKCGKLLVANFDGHLTGVIDLPFEKLNLISKDIELEGLAIYKEWLLLADESASYHQLYSYHLNEKRFSIINASDVLINDTGYFGIEGIAVNEKENICYVLKERNADLQSEIRQFKISDSAGMIKLRYLKTTCVQHPGLSVPDRNIRYADFCFDSLHNRLMLIKSYFAGKKNPGSYYGIDTIVLARNGLISRNTIDNRKNDLCLYNLSKQVFELAQLKLPGNKSYSTNLEGICLYNNSIYLVSDNSQSRAGCSEASQERTLLLRMDLR